MEIKFIYLLIEYTDERIPRGDSAAGILLAALRRDGSGVAF